MRPRPLTRRKFLEVSTASAGALLGHSAWGAPIGANERINLGVIGLGWRGGELLEAFKGLPGVRISALCDVDQQRLDEAAEKFPQAQTFGDLRKLIESKDVDAVAIATCNHWHCLAAMWACQAGKDIYVEKPLGHTIEEQQRLVKVSRSHGRVVQVGTQQRSDPMQAEIKQFLHGEKGIGPLQHVIVSRIGKRPPIGKRTTPLAVPKTVNYDLWLGPTWDAPICRDNFHYDWHWVWNTGNGEMGNWGVHILDDVRNVALQDEVRMPSAVYSAGTRAAWNDAGATPNVQVAYFANDRVPIYMLVSNVGPAETMRNGVAYSGDDTGYTICAEGGELRGTRGRCSAYDSKGALIKEFHGDQGASHAAGFLNAVRSRDRSQLAADVEVGHLSSAWCHLASMAALEGSASGASGENGIADAPPAMWHELLTAYRQQVKEYDSDSLESLREGRVEVDLGTESVSAPKSAAAARLLHYSYRPRYGESDL
jgi:predicted dehydrogenase